MREFIRHGLAMLLCFTVMFTSVPELLSLAVVAVEATTEEANKNVSNANNDTIETDNAISLRSAPTDDPLVIPEGVEDGNISGDITLTEDTAYFNLSITSGTINLNSYTLTVYGNVSHSGGVVKFNGGSWIVNGDYSISGTGMFEMSSDEDYFLIRGDLSASTTADYLTYYSGYRLNAGTIEVKGNIDTSSSNYPIKAGGTHKFVFSGDDEQSISFLHSSSNSRIGQISILNDQLTFTSAVHFISLENDCTVKSFLDLQGDLAGHDLVVTDGIIGNIELNINGGSLTVFGDVSHTGGVVRFNGGSWTINGDYSISGKGMFEMLSDEDYFLIKGNLSASTTADYLTYYSGYKLNAGTIEVKGNIDTLSSNYPIKAGGTHKFVLSGSGLQIISFNHTSYYSSINILVLTKDYDMGYVITNTNYSHLYYAMQTNSYTDNVFSNLVSFDKNTQVAFHVYSRYDAPSGVLGASVTFNGVTKQTDSNGLVVFDKPISNAASLSISKYGYHDYTIPVFEYDKETGCNYISLTPINVKSYLISATCNSKDVLTAAVRLDCSKNETVFITAEATSEYPIKEYKLMQGNAVIDTSLIGVFTINANLFSPKEQVSIRVQNTAGTVCTYGININVYDSKVKENSWPIVDHVNFAGNLSIKIDDDVPVVGGMTIKIGSETCPVSFNASKDKIKIGINVPVDETTTYNSEVLLKYLTHNETEKQKEGFKTTLAGYLECVFDENGNLIKTKGVGYVTFGYTGSYDFTTVIGVVPVTLGVSVSASAGITISMIGYDFENSCFLFPELGWTATGAITAKAGVGVKYLNAGVYGSLSSTFMGDVFPDFAFKKWTISGEIGVYGKIAIFEGKIPVLKTGTLQVYPYESAVMAKNRSIMNKKALYSPEEYTLITYTAALSNALESYAIENGWVLEADAYSYIDPQIVTCGDMTVMAYLNHDDTRPEANEQVLVYRIFDSENSTWGDPISVDDNLTADSEFVLYTDGENIYLIYTEAKEVLASDIDILTYPQKIDVAIAVFDPSTQLFNGIAKLTNNGIYETMPTVGVVNDIPTAVWVSNASNDIFCANEGNSIVMSRFINGNWTNSTTLLSDLSAVTDLTIGILDGKAVIAYIVDKDCDLSTTENRQLCLYSISDASNCVVAEDMEISELNITEIENNSVLMWCAEGNLHYITDVDAVAQALFEGAVPGLDNYSIIQNDDGKTAILFLRNEENARNIWSIYGNRITNTWGKPVRLTEKADYVNAYDAFFAGDRLAVNYLFTSITNTNDLFETSSQLIFEMPENTEDIGISNVEIDLSSVVPGEASNATVTVKNNGADPICSFVIALKDNESNTLTTIPYTVTVESGSTADVEFAFTVPAIVSNDSFSYTVSTEEISDQIESNNSYSFEIWNSDLSISANQVIIAGGNYIRANVRNGGYLPADGTISVADLSGNTLAEKPIKTLNFGEAEEVLINLETDYFDDSENVGYIVYVNSNQSDYDSSNNDVSLYVVGVSHSNGSEIICEHNYGDWFIAISATPESVGYRQRICTVCGNVETEEIPKVSTLSFAGTSLILQENPKVNFAVKRDLIDSNEYTNPFVVFSIMGNDIMVSDYETNDSYYIFSLSLIGVNQLNDEITVMLHATYEGNMYSSNPINSTALNFGTMECDLNEDGVVDIRDLVRLKKILSGVSAPEKPDDVIDFDFNGTLDALDLTYLVKILLFS